MGQNNDHRDEVLGKASRSKALGLTREQQTGSVFARVSALDTSRNFPVFSNPAKIDASMFRVRKQKSLSKLNSDVRRTEVEKRFQQMGGEKR